MCGRLYLYLKGPAQEWLLIVWQLFYKSIKEGHCNEKIDNSSTVLTLYWFRTETQAIYSTTRNNFKRLLPFQRLLISFRMKYLRITSIITAPQIIPPLMQYGPSDIFTRSFFFSLWVVISCFFCWEFEIILIHISEHIYWYFCWEVILHIGE